MSRGDLRTADVVEKAWENGAKFDNWTDFFNYRIWQKSFSEAGVDIDFYTIRRYPEDEVLPWDIVDIGIKKEWFLKEYRKLKKMSVNIVRFKFFKKDEFKYLSHLDVLALMERALIRTGMPLVYSGGFHPKPKLSFSNPIPLGVQSLAEYCDIELAEEISADDFILHNQH